MPGEQRMVLVLGGSTFMGKDLLEVLNSDPSYKVFFVNRGRKYWNNEVNRFSNLHYYNGNREDHHQFTKLLKYISHTNGISASKKWHSIVDFSAFKFTDVECVRQAVQGICNLYIFISTDSIYDVLKEDKPAQTGRAEYETLPQLSKEQKARAKDKEEYGYNKSKCEMFLARQKDLKKFPYISLILPDVVGPYDDTGRFWAYLKWIQGKQKVELDDISETVKLSLVYSKDVVRLIHNILEGVITISEKQLQQSYNLAFDENPTLSELIEMIAKSIGKRVQSVHKSSARSFYPSVDFGHIDTIKAKEALGWQPTPMTQAIATTSQFFLKRGGQFETENGAAEKKLKKKLKLQ